MKNPWIDGPRELLQHAIDHLTHGDDFDRRVAMISIDNAVELTIKTYLGLPKRALDHQGPSRKELEQASESFPALLDLLEKYASEKIVGLGLDDLEWYHRIRNQLYHSGNGITVEKSKVETYFELASGLFENLFGSPPKISHVGAVRTKTGVFLEAWIQFEKKLRSQLPEKKGPAYYWKRDFLKVIHPNAVELFNAVSMFRNELVHGAIEPNVSELEEQTDNLAKLMKYITKANAEPGA
ncbi:MAG: hypothetical protein JRE64_12815 [Deltaproteobacteria bacterium]|nr:hypothetical protein [Deltaproteobacteria bacterium]